MSYRLGLKHIVFAHMPVLAFGVDLLFVAKETRYGKVVSERSPVSIAVSNFHGTALKPTVRFKSKSSALRNVLMKVGSDILGRTILSGRVNHADAVITASLWTRFWHGITTHASIVVRLVQDFMPITSCRTRIIQKDGMILPMALLYVSRATGMCIQRNLRY